MKFEVR